MSKNFEYRYVFTGNKIIAISSYAGRTVKGVAKCHPNDEFDLEAGKALAAARCNKKIAAKRWARALKKYNEAFDEMNRIVEEYDKARSYMMDAREAFFAAGDTLTEVYNGVTHRDS